MSNVTLVGPNPSEKIVVYPKVNVYRGMLPEWKDFIDLLKESEKINKKTAFFDEWQDWYGFGTMMNIHMVHDLSQNLDSDYANMQKRFIQAIQNAFYKCTQDYVMQWNVRLPNWVNAGISICKYWPSRHNNEYAMTYHTDYRGFEADKPGEKFGITCTIYINDDYDGGGLSFLHEETGEVIDYKPKAGDVVVFPSGEPYWHAVHRISNNDKYFIRCFWSYTSPGSNEWHENEKKYGSELWKKMEDDRLKEEIKSGRWHKHVVMPGEEDPNLPGSTPFFAKSKRTIS